MIKWVKQYGDSYGLSDDAIQIMLWMRLAANVHKMASLGGPDKK